VRFSTIPTAWHRSTSSRLLPTRVHYHKRLTEIYYILAGEGEMELDGGATLSAPATIPTAALLTPAVGSWGVEHSDPRV
jgi:hypothetical protein